MENKDSLVKGDVEKYSLINKYILNPIAKITKTKNIKFLAWVIAVFSSLANLTLIVMKYVSPALSNTNITGIMIVFTIIVFICFVVVYKF